MSPRLRRLSGFDTGFPASDAQTDFSRARRERVLARLTARLAVRTARLDRGHCRPLEGIRPRVPPDLEQCARPVARAQGRTHIDAYVTEVETKVGADSAIRPADLPLKGEGVEAWGLRAIQARGLMRTHEWSEKILTELRPKLD